MGKSRILQSPVNKVKFKMLPNASNRFFIFCRSRNSPYSVTPNNELVTIIAHIHIARTCNETLFARY